MRLSKGKTAVTVNASLILASIPPQTFSYRLGNRSALEWVIDQHQVRSDKRSGIRSDPNRPDDAEYIVPSRRPSGARQRGDGTHCRRSAGEILPVRQPTDEMGRYNGQSAAQIMIPERYP